MNAGAVNNFTGVWRRNCQRRGVVESLAWLVKRRLLFDCVVDGNAATVAEEGIVFGSKQVDRRVTNVEWQRRSRYREPSVGRADLVFVAMGVLTILVVFRC